MIGADKMPILLPSLCSKVQPPRFQNQETKLMKRGQIPTSADALKLLNIGPKNTPWRHF